MMDMIEAAKETLKVAVSKGYDKEGADILEYIPELDYPHIKSMVECMETTVMSPTKIGRWLGWIQAACVAGTNGEMTLEDCKQINKKYSGKD